jgi:hypothetical protein
MNDRQVMRGFIANIEMFPPLIVTFQFNPTSVSDNKEVNYADGKSDMCGNAPGKVYTGGGHRTITFQIVLDGLEKGTNALNPSGVDNGISTELAKLRSFLYPKPDPWDVLGPLASSSAKGKRITPPPTCVFGFGTRILACVVTSISIEEKLFNSSLAPVRAEANITLVVNEEDDNGLYELDKAHRVMMAALGIQNVSIF